MTQHFKIIAIMGIFAVGLGAFAAHGLKPSLDANQIEIFKTASSYHFIHLIAMLGIAIAYMNAGEKQKSIFNLSFWMFFIGIVFFAGSLYILSTRHLIGGDVWTFVGPITPIGGLFFIVGWANLLRLN